MSVKVFVIKNLVGYYLEVLSAYDTPIFTDDIDKARQYRKQGYAQRTITSAVNHANFVIAEAEQMLDTKTGHIGYYTDRKNDFTNSLAKLTTLTIHEIEVDKSNIQGKNDIAVELFDQKAVSQGYVGLNKHSKYSGKSPCRCCGMILKQVPYTEIGGWRRVLRVCAFCIRDLQEFAESEISKMKPEHRDEIEGERFIHRLE
jgi:hypothetical protein